jgi:UDP-3-O-[3-hydroxymyristoyl] glucosamine N-acyltransferase
MSGFQDTVENLKHHLKNMTFHQPQKLKTIAELIGAKFVGSEDFEVLGTNEIHMVKAGEIVFVNHPKYYDKALNSAATIILIDKEVECPEGKALWFLMILSEI